MSKLSRTYIVEETPVLDTNAYATGDRLGAIQELEGAVANVDHYSVLASLSIVDREFQSAAMDILFFDALPTVASADNAAISITDAEMADKFLGHISVSASDWVTITASGNSVATFKNLGLILRNGVSATSVFVVLVSRGSPTYAANSLTFRYGLLQE